MWNKFSVLGEVHRSACFFTVTENSIYLSVKQCWSPPPSGSSPLLQQEKWHYPLLIYWLCSFYLFYWYEESLAWFLQLATTAYWKRRPGDFPWISVKKKNYLICMCSRKGRRHWVIIISSTFNVLHLHLMSLWMTDLWKWRH